MASLSSSPSATTTEITQEELERHKSRGDAWIAIDGKVYDVSKFAERHPGGLASISRGFGRDASQGFHLIKSHKDVDIVKTLGNDGRLIGVLKTKK